MTDDEIIQWLDETELEDLTGPELEAVRDRIRSSERVRQALRDRLSLEHALASVAGGIHLSALQILAEARSQAARRWRLWFLGIGFLLVAGSILIWLGMPAPAPDEIAVAPPAAPAPIDEPKAPGEEPAAVAVEPATPEPDAAGAATDVRLEPGPEVSLVAPPAPASTAAEDSGIAPVELAYGGALKTFAETVLDDLDEASVFPTRRQLRSWLQPIKDVRGEVNEREERGRLVCRLDGLFELSPLSNGRWDDELVLRFSLAELQGFRLHLWDGQSGLTLRYHSTNGVWAAYRSTRTQEIQRPGLLELLASDTGRYRRAGEGLLELRRRDGRVTLSRGGLLLLSAPFAARPSEVFLEGRMAVKGLALYRGAPFPEPREVARATVRTLGAPGAAAFQSPKARRAIVETLDGGAWRIAAADTKAGALAYIEAGCEPPFEALFKLEDVMPGVGLYVGDGSGQPADALGVFKRTGTDQLALGFTRPDSGQTEIPLTDDRGPLPLVGRSLWVRLLASPWGLRASSSPDGVFWSEALPPQKSAVELRCSTVGLFVTKGARNGALKLSRLDVRQFGSLAAVRRGRSLSEHRDHLLETILEWAADGSIPPEDIPGVIECAVLIDGRAEGLDSLRIDRALERLAGALGDGGEQRARAQIFTALLSADFPTAGRFDPIPEALFRSEALEAVYLRDWDRASSLTRWFELWEPLIRTLDPRGDSAQGREGRSRSRALAGWTRAVAGKESPAHAVAPVPNVAGAQHPLLVELSKEGYNVLTELEAALASESYRDACEILSAVEGRGAQGLVPDPRDPELLVSLTSAVKLALKDYPKLERTLRDEFGPLAMLRYREAKAESDATAMEALTIQFVGTEAASEAHSWLGDRRLSQGSFAEALSHYERAMENASSANQQQLSARIRIAAAYLGRIPSVESSPSQVELGGMRLEAREIERIISTIQKSAAPGDSSATLAGIPAPGACATRSWARFEHLLEQKPQGLPDGPDDWIGRQLALTVEGGVRLFSDRSQVIAWDSGRGERLWSQVLKEDGGRWPLVPMTPRLVGKQVVARRMTSSGPELIAINAASGAIEWRTRLGHHAASDPIVCNGAVHALAVQSSDEAQLDLSLVQIDLGSGEALSRAPLARFRDVWDRQIPCQATVRGSELFINAGGVTMRADLSGKILWLRRQTLLPPTQDPYGLEMDPKPPIVVGERVFTLAQGVRCVEALDARSGRLAWRRVLPRASRLCGVTGETAIVRELQTVLALRADTGALAWRRDLPGLVRVEAVGPIRASRGARGGESKSADLVVCLCVEGAGPRVPYLLWLETGTGTEVGRARLPELSGDKLDLGPLDFADGRIWTLVARGKGHEVELVEISPR